MKAITAIYPVGGTPRAEHDFRGFFNEVLGQLQRAGIVLLGDCLNCDIVRTIPPCIAAVLSASPAIARASVSLEADQLAPSVRDFVFAATASEWDDDNDATGSSLAVPQLHIAVFCEPVSFSGTMGSISSWALIAFSYEERDLDPEHYGLKGRSQLLFTHLRVITPEWQSAVLPIAG